MLRYVRTSIHGVIVAAVSLLPSCAALPDLAVVLEAVTFTHDERSGLKGDHQLKMALVEGLPREADVAAMSSEIAGIRPKFSQLKKEEQALVIAAEQLIALRKELKRIDPSIEAALDSNCSRSFTGEIIRLQQMRVGAPPAFVLPGLAPSDLIVSGGQLAYRLVIGQLQSKIKKLEEESRATYTFRQSRTIKWQSVRCMLAWRHLKDGPTEPDMLLLLARESLADASALKIAYVRVNRAIAKTAAGTEQRPASIQLDIAVSVFAAHTEKQRPVVSQLTHQVFRPLTKVTLGKPTPVCVRKDSPFETSCNMQSELFPNPPPTASAFSVGIAITETGSALGQAARAKSSLASLDALVKPKFEAILKQVAAEATK